MKRKDYDDAMDAVNKMVAKRRATKVKVAEGYRDLVNKYAMEYFSDVEELNVSNTCSTTLLAASFYSLKTKIQSIDPGVSITSLWTTADNGKIECINHIKIIWSISYSTLNNIEREINIDQFDCILAFRLSDKNVKIIKEIK